MYEPKALKTLELCVHLLLQNQYVSKKRKKKERKKIW